MKNNIFRYPDKPLTEIRREQLDELEGHGYMATLKMDGWRCLTREAGPNERGEYMPLVYTSREEKPLPVSHTMRVMFEPWLRCQRLPAGGALFDAEWNSRRPGARCEHLWLFDLLELDGMDLRSQPAMARWCALLTAVPRETWLFVVPMVTSDFGAFYDKYQNGTDDLSLGAEGIVLKHQDSRHVGSVRQCALNPQWIKCKWRSGESGETPR